MQICINTVAITGNYSTIGKELAMDKNFEKLFYEKIEEKKYRVIMSCISSMVRSVLVLLPTLLMRYVYNSLELGLDSKGIVGIILITFVIPVIVGVTFSVDIHLSKYRSFKASLGSETE